MSPLPVHTLNIYPLLGPEGAFWYAPSLLARLYFFIRPSGGCQSPRGCQSTLILIRTWVLSGVNGSQQLLTGFSQSYHNSSITHCAQTRTHRQTRTHPHKQKQDTVPVCKMKGKMQVWCWKNHHTLKKFTLKSTNEITLNISQFRTMIISKAAIQYILKSLGGESPFLLNFPCE